jgi:calcineurin-like phosphoesterase family protein
MTNWFTSDTHFCHANIIKYSNRPFASVEQMNEALIQRWNSCVKPTDSVIHLGDYGLGGLENCLPILSRLNGRKYLVPGNHDKCSPSYYPLDKRHRAVDFQQRYLDAGFEDICENVQMIETELLGYVVLSHFPYVGDSGPEDRHVEFRPKDKGMWLIHGHVHERWAQRGKMINVGVDARNGYPVSEEQIAEIISRGPADVPAQMIS